MDFIVGEFSFLVRLTTRELSAHSLVEPSFHSWLIDLLLSLPG